MSKTSKRIVRIIQQFLLLIPVFLTSCVLENDKYESEIGNVIWSKSRHCAFTDLVEYNGKVYCTFREADAHVPGDASGYGKIRLLETSDGKSWKSIGTLSDTSFDLRDPKLSITPNGRLMLLCGRYSLDQNSQHAWTMVKFISDAEISSCELTKNDIHEISIDDDQTLSNYWLWRVRWLNDCAYGVAYKGGNNPLLVKSIDGINYSVVATLDAMGNEADVELMDDGRMLIVMRAQKGNGFIGCASVPFEKWDWHETSNLIHCPAIVSYESSIYVAGRSEYGTTLFEYINNDLSPIMALPSDGDSAYPGIIAKDGELWISYYGTPNTTSILFSKISIEKLIDGK